MTVYEATLIGVSDDPRVESDFSRILDAAVDPPLEMCRRMADLRKGEGGEWENAVFLANCVGYLEVSRFWICFWGTLGTLGGEGGGGEVVRGKESERKTRRVVALGFVLERVFADSSSFFSFLSRTS